MSLKIRIASLFSVNSINDRMRVQQIFSGTVTTNMNATLTRP